MHLFLGPLVRVIWTLPLEDHAANTNSYTRLTACIGSNTGTLISKYWYYHVKLLLKRRYYHVQRLEDE